MLEQFIPHFQHLGTCIKMLTGIINYLPYFVPREGLGLFNELNADYQDLHHRFLEIKEALEHQAVDIRALGTELQHFARLSNKGHRIVADNLRLLIANIKPEITTTVSGVPVSLSDIVRRIITLHEDLYRLSCTTTELSSYQATKDTLEQELATLFGTINGIQASLSQGILLKHLYPDGVVARVLKEEFSRAKELQHLIYRVNQVQQDFSCIYRGFNVTPVPIDQLLPKECYLDLVFLTYLIKTEFICAALANKLFILEFKNEQLHNKIQRFRGYNLPKLVRVQRIITAYQNWLKVLQEQLPKITANDLLTSLFIQQLLTYEKKAFLTKLFHAQTLTSIINSMEKTLLSKEEEPRDRIYAYFELEKNSIKLQVQTIETRIRANQTYTQAIIATALLGITKQPEYQLGQLGALLNTHMLDQSSLPILKEKLPPELLSKLCHATGASFLSISMYVSAKFGYSYQLIAFINRILLSQIDLIFKLGTYGEKLTQYTGYPILDTLKKITPTKFISTLDWLKETLAFDELGIIEKDRIITWFSGLGIQTIMSLGNIVPAVIGYISGTAIAEASSTIVDAFAKAYDCSETTNTALKLTAHFISYSYAYSFGYKLGLQWLTNQEQNMSQSQAFAVLGLGQYARAKEVQQKYRELALQYHPDRCKVDCEQATAKMVEINKAYELLQKKFI